MVKEQKMKIKLKAPFGLNGHRLEAGEHDLPERIAQALIARGVAEHVTKRNKKGVKR